MSDRHFIMVKNPVFLCRMTSNINFDKTTRAVPHFDGEL